MKTRSTLRALTLPFALSAVALAVTPMLAHANQSLSVTGYGLTTGAVFNRANLGSAAFNPANPMRLLSPNDTYRISGFEVGARYEIGDLNNVAGMRDDIEADVRSATSSLTLDSATQLAQKVMNTYVPALNAGAHLSVQSRASLAAPAIFRTPEHAPGVWSVNANAQAQVRGAFHGSGVGILVKLRNSQQSVNVEVPLTDLLVNGVLSDLEDAATSGSISAQKTALQNLLDALAQTEDRDGLKAMISSTVAGNPVSAKFAARTASAFDFKAAEVNQLSLGYAQDVTEYAPAELRQLLPAGRLDLGMRLNAYQANLYRQVMALVDEQGNPNTIEFSTDQNFSSSTFSVGLDLGVLWSDENYQFGATIYNINRPRFVYPNPMKDSNAANRFAANSLASTGSLKLEEEVVLKPHMVLEASVYTSDKVWLLQGSLATNETTDFVGDPQRVVTLSGSFNAELMPELGGWVPNMRLGLRQNTVGSKLTTLGIWHELGAVQH